MPPEWWLAPCSRACFDSLRKREQSIGVSVKLTAIEQRIETAHVTPNEKKNLPTRPDMNAIGKKITTSDSVVATTASVISLVAPSAASHAPIPFSSIQRKM